MQRAVPCFVGCSRCLAVSCPARAQPAPYPTRTVEIIVSYGAGGSTDIVARAVAQKLTERLGQPFVVLNRPGASGTIGIKTAMRAKPDGYTLYVGYTSETVVVPQISKTATYSVVDDFEPIAITGLVPVVLIVSKNVKADNLQGLHRRGPRQSGQVHLRRQRRQPAARHGRLDEQAPRPQRHAHSLPRRRAGRHRRDRRPYRHVLWRRRGGESPRSTAARSRRSR